MSDVAIIYGATTRVNRTIIEMSILNHLPGIIGATSVNYSWNYICDKFQGIC